MKYETILVPYDFSEHADAALERATDLAERLGAKVRLLHVVQPPIYPYASLGSGAGAMGAAGTAPVPGLLEIHKQAEESTSRIAAGRDYDVVEGSDVARAIRDFAAKCKADMIVMGTHGRSGIAHVFLGSVAERTLRGAPCPVLTVQGPEDESGSSQGGKS